MGELFRPGDKVPFMGVSHERIGESDAEPRDFLPVSLRRNPFERETTPVKVAAGTTIFEIVVAAGIEPRFHDFIRVWVNDREVPRHLWHRVRPKMGATVYVHTTPMGGGDRKNILASLLMLVVVVAAAVFAPMIAGAMFPGLTGTGLKLATSVISTGITMLGAMAISALIPPPKFDTGIASPMQLLSGVKNSFAPYADLPRVYGKRRIYPMLAARPYTEAQGKKRFLRVLLAVGLGPLKITDIKIGETPIGAYKKVEVEKLEGWATEHAEFGGFPVGKTADGAPTLFTKSVYEDELSILITPAPSESTPGPWFQQNTQIDADEFIVEVTFPSGLIRFTEEGEARSKTHTMEVEYRLVGDTVWTQANWADKDEDDGTKENHKLALKAKSRSPTMMGGRVKLPAKGQYTVRMRSLSDDEGPRHIITAYWTALRTVRYENPVNMAGLALIAVRMQATEQLNGMPDTINCIAESYLPTYDANAQTWTWATSSNPGWAYADTLRRRGAERVIADSRIDLPAIAAWAADCDALAPNAAEPRWSINAVSERGSILTTLQQIAGTARGRFITRDGKYSVARDIPQTVPVQHITPHNSWGYGGSKPFVDYPDALRISFQNAARGWQEDEVVVYADGYNAGNAKKFETMPMPSCTSATQAWREGRYYHAVGRLRPEEHTVMQDVENLRASVGDLVQLAHDVLSIGIGTGRITDVAGTGGLTDMIAVENEHPHLVGRSYVMRVRKANGESVLYPLVAAVADTNTTVFELVTPVTAATGPQPGDLYIYGEAGVESAPMLIKSIEHMEGLTARLTLVDAQPVVHTADTGAIPAFQTYISDDDPADQQTPPVPRIQVSSGEGVAARGEDGTVLPRISILIRPQPAGVVETAHYIIQYREIEDLVAVEHWNEISIQNADETVAFITGVSAGEVFDIRVRAVSPTGSSSDWALVGGHVVIGQEIVPAAVTGISVTAGINSVTLDWVRSPEIYIAGYEVYLSATSTPAPSGASVPAYFAASDIIVISGLTAGVEQFFWIRAVTRSGLYSAWAGPVSATPSATIEAPPAPNVPAGLALSSVAPGNGLATLIATWSVAANAVSYEVGATKSGGSEVIYPVNGTRWEFATTANTLFDVRIRSINALGQASAWSAVVQHTTAVDTVPPAVPTGLAAQAGVNMIWVSWNANTESDLQGYELFEQAASTPAPGAGTAPTFVTAAPTFLRSGLDYATTRHYWVRAVDTSGNKSAWTAAVSAATPAKPGVVTADLAGLVDATSFASSIKPVEILGALPGTPHVEGRMVFLTTDNKLYRNTGSGWTAAVPSTDITGQLTDAQIAAIAAAKITGQLTDAQIAALAAAKLTGQITTTQITDDAITTPKIAAGAVTATEIAALTITAGQIAASTITGAKIAANTITATQIAALTITAAEIAASTITGAKIAANTITATQIAANTITAAQIAANTITAGQIAAGAISTDQLAANAVTAGKMLLADTNNLWKQPAPTGTAEDGVDVVSPAAIIADPTANSAISTHVFHLPAAPASTAYVDARPGSVTNRLNCVPAQAGESFYFSFQAYCDVVPSSLYVQCVGYTATGSGSSPSVSVVSQMVAGSWVRVTAKVTISATTTAYIVPRIAKATSSTGNVYFTDVRVWRANAAELIVDGSIQANHLSAGEIITGTAQIKDAIITNAKIANLDAAKINTGTLNAARIGASAITADKIATNAITADKVAANAITATKIAANAITASKLYLADVTNIYPDRDFFDQTAWSGVSSYLDTTAVTWETTRYARLIGATSSYVFAYGPKFSVEPGEEIYVSFTHQVVSSGSIGVSIQCDDNYELSSITEVWPVTLSGNLTSTTVIRWAGKFTIPAGSKWARVRIYKGNNGPSEVRFGSVIVRRRAQGELIVDGAITADKIASNAITADKIAANAITATKIAATTITADRLVVGTIDRIRLADGSVSDTFQEIALGPFASGYSSAYVTLAMGAIPRGNIYQRGVVFEARCTGAIAGEVVLETRSAQLGGSFGSWKVVKTFAIPGSSGWDVYNDSGNLSGYHDNFEYRLRQTMAFAEVRNVYLTVVRATK